MNRSFLLRGAVRRPGAYEAFVRGWQRGTSAKTLRELQELARRWKPVPWLFRSFVVTGLTSR